MEGRWALSATVVCLCFAIAATAPLRPYPSRVSCDASYNLPCSKTTSIWLVEQTVKKLQDLVDNGQDLGPFLNEVNDGKHNRDIGFYPIIFRHTEQNRLVYVANGQKNSIQDVKFDAVSELTTTTEADIIAAAQAGGGLVRYQPQNPIEWSKWMYVSNFSAVDLIIGAEYDDRFFPEDPTCNAHFDFWCAINNVRVQVGEMVMRFSNITSYEQFRQTAVKAYLETLRQNVCRDPEDGRLDGIVKFVTAYEMIPLDFGMSTSELVELSGKHDDGAKLHNDYVAAAEGALDGWVSYPFGSDLKIAKIENVHFEDLNYLVGASFHFLMPEIVMGPNDSPCSAEYALPCAFSAAQHLSSHTFTFLVSSAATVEETFRDLSIRDKNSQLNQYGFFIFAFDFNGTCVASGKHQDEMIGKNMINIAKEQNFSVDGQYLHELFHVSARSGGGWLFHEAIFESQNLMLTYIFHINLYGRDYYVGTSIMNDQVKMMPNMMRNAQSFGGGPVKCTRLYEDECNEHNIHSIVGMALVDFAIASQRIAGSSEHIRKMKAQKIFSDITFQSRKYIVNDFFVAVFSFNQSLCRIDDADAYFSPGCCVAHGANSSFVNRTWQDILDSDSITSISGIDLHIQLAELASRGGGRLIFPWKKDEGETRTKVVWVSKFQVGNDNFYIVADYFNSPVLPTCDACPNGMECTRNGQEYCETTSSNFNVVWMVIISASAVFLVCAAILLFVVKRQRRYAFEYRRAHDLDEQMEKVWKITSLRSSLGVMPPLPQGVDFLDENGETILEVRKGQIIQVSSEHPDGIWLFGTILFDPMARDAKNQSRRTLASNLAIWFAGVLHRQPTSGWFPRDFAVPVSSKDMVLLVRELGRTNFLDDLKVPDEWEQIMTPEDVSLYGSGRRIKLKKNSPIYNSKVDFFLKSLKSTKYEVVNIELVLNLPLWQTYAMKRLTIKQKHEERLRNNESVNNKGKVEKKLFHGTSSSSVIDRISEQGFNRAFCGQHGVLYGKGSYFARNSADASDYAKADYDGVKKIFLCRVAVGDYAMGYPGQPAPDAIPNRSVVELYDTTVDNLKKPKIYVAYGDSQAYPEYLIHFRKVHDV